MIKFIFFFPLYLLANVNIDNNNNNANNENMIMFTPMNGKRTFDRIRRNAEDEWINEIDVLSQHERPEAQKILLDAIKFYLNYIRHRQSNTSQICDNGQMLINNFPEQSLHWKFTMKHIFNGMFKIAEDPIFCEFI